MMILYLESIVNRKISGRDLGHAWKNQLKRVMYPAAIHVSSTGEMWRRISCDKSYNLVHTVYNVCSGCKNSISSIIDKLPILG
jgi:hypothetical protein